jgi:hypothetical protein
MGKRGGVRVVFFWVPAPGLVYLLSIYAENQQENLSRAEQAALRELVARIKATSADGD